MKSMIRESGKFNITCDCKDPIKCLEHMFCDMVQKKRVEQDGQCPARRPVFLRTHGIIKGEMQILEDIPKDYQQGLFANQGKFPVYLRYSSDLADGRPDWKSTIGIGIKIFDLPNQIQLDKDDSHTADFILQNVPYFFVDTARDMCEFTKASFEGWGDEWIQENAPDTNKLLDDMEKPIRSVFETPLWSIVPFKLGENNFCKYIVKPGRSTFADDVDIDDPDFLAKDLAGRMNAGDATLDLYIQLRPDPEEYGQAYIDEHFPLDKATVIWSEKEAKPVKVASFVLPQQDISNHKQEVYGDWLSFNIGRTPLENAPVGTIAEARVKIYQVSADYRRKMNHQPVDEPKEPGHPAIKNPKCPFPHHSKPDPSPEPLDKHQIERIVTARIHPGIGVARVGNSAKEIYIGPEVMDPKPTAFGSTRDAAGAIKRQAARFRVFGYDQHGNVVAEIQQTAGTTVEWSVHVANRKAQWYEFNAAMDIPATVSVEVPLRNPDVTGSAREALCIDPGEKKIMGLNMRDSSYMMTGNFQGTPVTLGELRTDSVGRLLFLGGSGVSASPGQCPIYTPSAPTSFNNPSGWYDDTSDGPVHAKVTIGDKVLDADPAWVITGPPNFAPDAIGWRTMDDLMRQVYITSGMLELPKRISFQQNVLPILQRMNGLQWVNKGIASMFGADGPMNFADKGLLEKVSKAPTSQLYPDPYAELRRTIYNSFRSTNSRTADEGAWPWQYGDAFGYTDPDPSVPPSPNKYLKLPPAYDYVLSLWVKGDFLSDYQPDTKTQTLQDVGLQEQPEMLDRAAMHFCLADAFHPGCEMTWPMRHASMYRGKYRIRQREEGKTEPTYGTKLTHNLVLAVGGPLYEQGPGDLTKWMAIPWQGDTAFCRSGYDMEYDPYLPTFWPARVPNQVLSEIDYDTLFDSSQPMDVRVAAFNNRPAWIRQIPQSLTAPEQILHMVDNFAEMGILEAKPKPEDMDWLPDLLYVENLTQVKRAELDAAYKLFQQNYAKLGATDRLLSEAGWESEEQRNQFAVIKRRGN